MTPKKILPQSLLNLNSNLLMKNIMDRSKDLFITIEKVKKLWGFDMYTRTPSQTLDGKTNLDLACVFYSLAERSAAIIIPKYKSLRPKSVDDPDVKEARTGKIISLSSNKDLFSFSIKIFDEVVNEYRSFCITDPRGNFYLKEFVWTPTVQEKEYLLENEVSSSLNNQISFKNFVHPNRWTSFYGQNYFITKALIQRIEDECKDIFSQIKAMEKKGFTYPKDDKNSKPWPKKIKESGKPIIFKSLEVEVDFPMINKFLEYKSSQGYMVLLTDIRKNYIYSILPILRFATRCTELAFFKYANNKLPSWLGGGVKWESGFKLPKKRIEWDRLKIVQPTVGEFSLAIRKRIKEKSEIMAHDFEPNGIIS